MWHAGVEQTRRYRLTGCLHDFERAGFGLYSFSPTGVALLAGYTAFDRSNIDKGQWLEALLPQDLTGYWSLHACNHWCESLPGAGAQDLNATPDADARIRVRIGPAVPATLNNRVDTLGRRHGALIFRAIGAATKQLQQVAMLR